jgi:hypothetical protein
VHPSQDRDGTVDIVVDLDRVFVVFEAHQTPDVLDDAALESERKGEEEGIECRAVESFADIGSDREQHERAVRWVVELGEHVSANSLAEATTQHQRFDAACRELLEQGLEMEAPLRQDEAVATPGGRFSDIGGDVSRAGVVRDEFAEDLLDLELLCVGWRVVCFVNDESAIERGARSLASFDRVADGSALHHDDVLELVAPIGGVAVRPSQVRAGMRLTAASNVAAGTW